MTLLRSFPAFAPEAKTEPAKRWRNVFQCNIDDGAFYFPCDACGVGKSSYGVGERYSCGCTYPSRDIAETTAAEIIAEAHAEGFDLDDYLGAFPVEEGE